MEKEISKSALKSDELCSNNHVRWRVLHWLRLRRYMRWWIRNIWHNV